MPFSVRVVISTCIELSKTSYYNVKVILKPECAYVHTHADMQYANTNEKTQSLLFSSPVTHTHTHTHSRSHLVHSLCFNQGRSSVITSSAENIFNERERETGRGGGVCVSVRQSEKERRGSGRERENLRSGS